MVLKVSFKKLVFAPGSIARLNSGPFNSSLRPDLPLKNKQVFKDKSLATEGLKPFSHEPTVRTTKAHSVSF